MRDTKATVLVVDDEPVVCVMLQALLEKAGYAVFVAESGAIGIRYAVKYEPDLILLDIMLPDINGYEVHQRIKEIKSCTIIPVIFVTALEEKTVLKDCMKLGQGVDYILKPIQSEILLARVANILTVVRSRKELAERNEQLKLEIAERDRLNAVVQLCTDSVFIVDPLGAILYANPACEVNSGYSSDELVGTQLQNIRHMEKEEEKFQTMMEHVLAGKKWQGSMHNLRKDGSFYLEEISILPVISEGKDIQGHVVMKKDITERRRLESIASSVNLMDNVGFVFSGIRHELGNPVNSLKMTLSVLSKKIDEFSSDKIVDFLDRSLHEISRIEYLLTSLRSFSMFEHPVSANVSLPDFLENIIDIHQKDIDSARIQITLIIEEDAEIVFVDERAMLQVMLNLFSNAMTALEGTKVPVITIHVFRESKNLVCLSFGDNGCGMSSKNQEMLFKPFFTTRPEGTGLGLVIVQKMLAEMDCSIQVVSQEQVGTSFAILLPGVLE